MQRLCFLLFCTFSTKNSLQNTLGKGKICLLFADLNWKFKLSTWGFSCFWNQSCLPCFLAPQGSLYFYNNKKLWLWRSHFPFLSQKQCQGHLREKVGGEAKLFAQSDKGAVPFPRNHRTDSLLLQIFGPLYPPHTSPPVINLPWKLSSVSWTNSNTWCSLISLFENNEVPQCYFKDLAAPVCPSPPTLFLGSSWS